MPLTLTTPPALEPLTLAEAKAHLKVDTSDDDALISAMIAAARARAEWHTGRAAITQGWTLHLDAWPQSGTIEIPLPPLQSVASVTTYARDDSATVMSASLYTVDAASAPARLALKIGVPPPANLRRVNAVILEQAGVPAASIQRVGPCTFCGDGPFASYRRRGANAGRQMSWIGLLAAEPPS